MLTGGRCSCKRRVDYAIATHRVNPQKLDYLELPKGGVDVYEYIEAMEKADDCSQLFSGLPMYGATKRTKEFLTGFLNSEVCNYIKNA